MQEALKPNKHQHKTNLLGYKSDFILSRKIKDNATTIISRCRKHWWSS